MFVQHDKIKNLLQNELQLALNQVLGADFLPDSELKALVYNGLTAAPNLKMGHIAFALFPFAKVAKKSPAQLASEVMAALPASELIKKAVVAGPYLNLFLATKTLGEDVLNSILEEKYFETPLTANPPKTIVEYSQPNTHKEMHVGHMRNLCLGDAVIKINRYCQIPTISTTFPGDVGTHVAKCLWFYKKHNKESAPTTRKGAWLGTLYTKGNNLLDSQKGTDQEAINKTELTEILKQIENKSGEYYNLWKETREWSVELMQEVYKWAKVEFDVWYWESDVDSSSVQFIKKLYTEGKLVKDDGAIGMDLEDDKLGFCLLLKSDGTGLYATKDVELARRKFEDHHVDQSIYVVDNRQARHFKQVFKVLEKIGFKQAKDCYHLQYEMVELTDGAMSSRKGNVVAIQSLIDQMVQKIKTDYLSRYADEWEQAEIEKVANQVAIGAIKYGMNRIDPNKKIVFEMQEWLRLDGESGPYIQYVCTRIGSMLKKLETSLSQQPKWECLVLEQEIALMLKVADFNNIVELAQKTHKTSTLCTYLYELAKLYNSFYAECPVANAETQELKVTRAALSKCVNLVLVHGLALLGIEAPERM